MCGARWTSECGAVRCSKRGQYALGAVEQVVNEVSSHGTVRRRGAGPVLVQVLLTGRVGIRVVLPTFQHGDVEIVIVFLWKVWVRSTKRVERKIGKTNAGRLSNPYVVIRERVENCQHGGLPCKSVSPHLNQARLLAAER